MPGLAVDVDEPTRLLDDAVYGGQAHAGSMASLLGREEGLEDAHPRLLVHADAGVGDREQEVGTGDRPGMGRHVGWVELDVAELDGELAAVGHGVARVHREIDDDLLQLTRVDRDAPQAGRLVRGELDVLAEEPAQHGDDTLDDCGRVENLGLKNLIAAEREQLPG